MENVTLVSRVKTQNNNFIAISYGEYGKYTILWLDSQMKNPKVAKLEDWIWATTWGTPIEFGDWKVDWLFENNIIFYDYAHGQSGEIFCLYTDMCKNNHLEDNGGFSNGTIESISRYKNKKQV